MCNIDDQARANNRFLLDKVKAVVTACQETTAAPIVLGGAGYSIFPRAALDYLGAEYGIQGEGESAFPELLDRLTSGRETASLPGLFARGGENKEPARIGSSARTAIPDPEW